MVPVGRHRQRAVGAEWGVSIYKNRYLFKVRRFYEDKGDIMRGPNPKQSNPSRRFQGINMTEKQTNTPPSNPSGQLSAVQGQKILPLSHNPNAPASIFANQFEIGFTNTEVVITFGEGGVPEMPAGSNALRARVVVPHLAFMGLANSVIIMAKALEELYGGPVPTFKPHTPEQMNALMSRLMEQMPSQINTPGSPVESNAEPQKQK